MKKWNDLYECWNDLPPPEVKVIPFVVEEHRNGASWFNKERKRQSFQQTNPINDTAYHVAVYLKDKEPELITAYKLYAYALSYDAHYSLRELVTKKLMSLGEPPYSWWQRNSKHVLPYTNYDSRIDFSNSNDADIVSFIERSKSKWQSIADEWELVLIPDFMDKTTEEYKQYVSHITAKAEERERLEHLRLKDKYESEQP